MTTTVSLTVLILALEMPFTELERGKKAARPLGLSLVLENLSKINSIDFTFQTFTSLLAKILEN
jgi:hypothetical protein